LIVLNVGLPDPIRTVSPTSFTTLVELVLDSNNRLASTALRSPEPISNLGTGKFMLIGSGAPV
jgi:hypothetical protein